MKNSIIILFMAVSSISVAQIRFEGTGETLDSLNTPNGQNYLVLNPFENALAYTEEQGGSNEAGAWYVEREQMVGNENWKVIVFSDWLGEKGMKSPIGFTSEGLLYNEVTFDKGMYYGKVGLLSNGKDQDVEIPFLKNKSPIQSGCISKDGQYMILSMESGNSRGVEDLYIVKKENRW